MIGGIGVLGSWGRTMRGAARSKERRKGRRAPTQDPSTNNLIGGEREARVHGTGAHKLNAEGDDDGDQLS